MPPVVRWACVRGKWVGSVGREPLSFGHVQLHDAAFMNGQRHRAVLQASESLADSREGVFQQSGGCRVVGGRFAMGIQALSSVMEN